MWFIVHVLFTIGLIKVFNITTNYEIMLAFIFGVLVDIDHLIRLPEYIRKNGWHVVHHWHFRTSIQEPFSYIWVIPLCILLDSWVPFVFFTGHLILDYVMSYEKTPLWPISRLSFDVHSHRKDWIAQLVASAISVALMIIA
ncbi:MAG: hypothetical protein V1659_01800 [Candidatus Woesearchaeota archaeon]